MHPFLHELAFPGHVPILQSVKITVSAIPVHIYQEISIWFSSTLLSRILPILRWVSRKIQYCPDCSDFTSSVQLPNRNASIGSAFRPLIIFLNRQRAGVGVQTVCAGLCEHAAKIALFGNKYETVRRAAYHRRWRCWRALIKPTFVFS